MFEVDAKELATILIENIRSGIVSMVTSSPGIGKSDIVKQIAKEYKLKLIDLRLSQCDPIDMQGFPYINKNSRMAFCIPEYFPIEGEDNPPEGYEGWLLFLDEFNSSSKQTEAAAYKLLLDRKVYNKNLHHKCAVIAAGNLMTDRAIVNKLSTATVSRMAHYKLQVDHEAWLSWAGKHDIDHRIISFLQFKPDLLHRFDPKSSDEIYPCPRTWEFTSKVIKDTESIQTLMSKRISGIIGTGPALEFVNYVEVYTTLPTIESILQNPTGWKVPESMDRQYAVAGLLAHHMTVDNSQEIVTAISQLPKEFQILSFRTIYKRDPSLHTCPAITQWISNNIDLLQ